MRTRRIADRLASVDDGWILLNRSTMEKLRLSDSKILSYLHHPTPYRYPATKDTKLKLYDGQEGRCKLCGKRLKLNDSIKDHDHSTGLIRGLVHEERNSLICSYKRHILRETDE